MLCTQTSHLGDTNGNGVFGLSFPPVLWHVDQNKDTSGCVSQDTQTLPRAAMQVLYRAEEV